MLLFIVVTILLVVVAYLYHYMRSSAGAPPTASQDASALSEYERHVTESEFPAMVVRNSYSTPVLVQFHASWCGPCHHFGPILAAAAKEYSGSFLLAKVDYDSSKQLVAKYGVVSLPTTILVVQGECTDRLVGAKEPHQLKFFLAQHGIRAPSDVAPQGGQT
jgi:thioredoxin